MNQLTPENALRYILGGHGKSTLVGKTTRYTYKFGTPKDKEAKIIFVALLTGNNNESDYQYIGFINKDKDMVAGKKGNPNHPAYKAFSWYLHQLNQHSEKASQATFYHEGVCACCGRTLTVPESIERGIGPECAKRYS